MDSLEGGRAHRKGSDYAKVAAHFEMEERGRSAVLRSLLVEGASMLGALAEHAEGLAPEGASRLSARVAATDDGAHSGQE